MYYYDEDRQNFYKEIQPFARDDITIRWEGFVANPRQLRGYGWTLDLVTNVFSERKKVYLRHKKLKMLGRFIYYPEELAYYNNPHDQDYELDFMTSEKKLRYIEPEKLQARVQNSKYEHNTTLIDITNTKIPEILNIIAEVQKLDLKPLPPKTADIIDLVEEANLLGLRKTA